MADPSIVPSHPRGRCREGGHARGCAPSVAYRKCFANLDTLILRRLVRTVELRSARPANKRLGRGDVVYGYTSPLVLYETATAFVGAVCFFRSTESCLPAACWRVCRRPRFV